MSKPTFDCEICLESLDETDAMALCGKGHRFCHQCCWGVCQTAIGEGLVPACPHDKAERCGAVSKSVAEEALTRWVAADVATRKADMVSWALRGSKKAGFKSQRLDKVYRDSELAAQGAVQCIGKGCKEYYVPERPHSRAPQRIVCTKPRCGASFCAACRQPYHFRTTCEEALRVHARWVKFLSSELAEFLREAVKVDPDRYAPIVKEHTRAKSALDEGTRDALARFQELREMELWKEKHCRRCPHCQRVVHKVSGCDEMHCGADADDGANQQRGCGKRFQWSRAPRYCADLRSAASDGGSESGGVGRERRLQIDASEAHLHAPGAPVTCDACGDAIVGPRLQCVLCPGSVDLCVGCVGRAARAQPLLLRDGSKHPKHHVFRRVRQPPLGDASSRGCVAVDLTGGTVDLTGSAEDQHAGAERGQNVSGGLALLTHAVDAVGGAGSGRADGAGASSAPGSSRERLTPSSRAQPIMIDCDSSECEHSDPEDARAGRRSPGSAALGGAIPAQGGPTPGSAAGPHSRAAGKRRLESDAATAGDAARARQQEAIIVLD